MRFNTTLVSTFLFVSIITMSSVGCNKERPVDANNAESIYYKNSLLAKAIMKSTVDYTLSKAESNGMLSLSDYSNIFVGSSFVNKSGDTSYSRDFKNMITNFVLLIRKPNYFRSNDDIKAFYLDNVSKLSKDSEKEEAARIITLSVELNSKIKEKNTNDRLLALRLKGSLPHFMIQNFQMLNTMTPVTFILYEVAAFVLGYIMAPAIQGCDTILCRIGIGLFFALGAYSGACLNDLLPWQQGTDKYTANTFCLFEEV